jgi:hypothetical protein
VRQECKAAPIFEKIFKSVEPPEGEPALEAILKSVEPSGGESALEAILKSVEPSGGESALEAILESIKVSRHEGAIHYRNAKPRRETGPDSPLYPRMHPGVHSTTRTLGLSLAGRRYHHDEG